MSENPHVYPFRRGGGQSGVASLHTRDAVMLKSGVNVGWLVLWTVLAFVFARAQILGGLFPFAPAFLAAIATTYPKKGALAALPLMLGLLTVVSGSQLFVYASIMLLLAVTFLLYTVDGRKQWFVLPGMVFAAVMVSKGLAMAVTGFDNYLMLTGVFEGLLAGGLSLVFMVIFNAIRRFEVSRRFSTDETICIFIASIGILCGLSGWQIGGLDLRGIAGCLLIIAVSYLGGAGAGAAVGALVGIVPSLSQVVAPSIIAAYSFSGLLGGVFSGFGRLGTVLGFILGNLILALYIMDSTQISVLLLTSVIAAIIFLILPKKLYGRLSRIFAVSGLISAKEEKNERLLRLAVRRLRNSGWMFRDLGNSIFSLTKEENDNTNDNLKSIMEQLSHQLCSKCSLNNICWEMDAQQSNEGIIMLFDAVEQNGTATVKDAPENFTKRCPHIKEFVAIINCLYDSYCRSNYWSAQRMSSCRLISRQLQGVAEIFDKISSEVTDYSDEREILERELHRAIAKRGMLVDSAGIIAINDKAVDVWVQYSECPGENVCRKSVADEVSRLLGCEFSVHECSCGNNNCVERCQYRLLARGAYRMTVGKAQLARDGKGICGDSGASLLLEGGRQLLMISDGMGTGEVAANESAAALSLISRLLEAGFVQDTAIETVNAALSLRGNEESFVTLDLCVVDLYDGRADFIKSGGAVSFIKRGSTIKAIKGSSLPVGMLYNVDRQIIKEQIFPGDMIILASDGLIDADTQDDAQWLSRVLSQTSCNSPQTLAEYLLDKVINVSSGKINDDITILVAKLGEIA